MAKIVVADDHPLTVSQIRNRLESDNHSVYTAFDGEGALRLILEKRPELIVLDATMPDAAGFNVLQQVRSNPELENTSIVTLTAQSNDDVTSADSQVRFESHLTRPAPLEEIAQVVRRLLAAGTGPDSGVPAHFIRNGVE